MSRRLLLASGTPVAPGVPWEPPPEDMTLNTYRAVTMPLTPSVNYATVPAPGETVRYRIAGGALRDSKALRLRITASHDVPVVGKWAIEYGGQTYPITFGGERQVTVEPQTTIVSDPTPAWKVFKAGQPLYVRGYSPTGLTSVHMAGTYASGDVADSLGPTNDPNQTHYGSVAGPVAILGMTTDTVCPAFVGDSIIYGGTANENGWINLATAAAGVPGIGLGVPVTVFYGVADFRWGGDPVGTLAPATHMLCQFSVNDLRIAESVESVYGWAITCWRYLKSKRDVPLFQTTTTPIVEESADGCATLEGQTVLAPYNSRRQAFVAWLRDGAPINGSDQAVVVGGTGIRAGEVGHPLTGIVDVAAAVEHSNTGKWRVDLGPLGGDGVHPSGRGMEVMSEPVAEWLATL